MLYERMKKIFGMTEEEYIEQFEVDKSANSRIMRKRSYVFVPEQAILSKKS